MLESVVLGLLGGAVGIGLAFGALRLLVALAPGNLPRMDDIGIDLPVLAFTLVLSVMSGLLFGAIPMFKYATAQLAPMLRGGGRSASASRERHRTRNVLVVAQIALALVLLVGSGLMIRTFQALRDVHPGFTRANEVQTLRFAIPDSQVKDEQAVVHMQQAILDKVAAVPGVTAVALASTVTMTGDGWHDPLYAQDKAYTESQLPTLRLFKFVSPGFMKTMGGALVAGRDFTWTDAYEQRPVAMVSESLARELWNEPSAALGKHVRPYQNGAWREVVGVLSDMRDDGLNKKPASAVYWPLLTKSFHRDARCEAPAGAKRDGRDSQHADGRQRVRRRAQPGGVGDQSQPAGERRAHPAGDLRQVAGADVVHAGHARHRRRHGAPARGRRPLRRDFLLRLATIARDRDPDRARRAGACGDPHVRHPRPGAGRRRRRDRSGGGALDHAPDVVAALRREPDRSPDLRAGVGAR